MQVQFAASQNLYIPIPEEPVPLQHYLRQPQRLVHALTDPKRVQQLGIDRFRLTMRPREFMAISFQPVVDLRVWSAASGIVHVQSTNCEIRGVEYLDQRFNLELIGQLTPQHRNQQTILQGGGDIKVTVDLPPIFGMTPKPILEAAGYSLLQGILLTFKQRLGSQLVADYRQWAGTKSLATSADGQQRLSTNPSSSM